MTSVAAVAFAVTGVFAIGNWWSRLRHDHRLEYVCKPATLVALTVAAIVLDPAAGASDRRAWFVAALVCSLAGDVLLMVGDHFVAGLAAFGVGHLFYVVGFWTDPPAPAGVALSAVAVAIVLVPVALRILGALAAEGERSLRGPVVVYVGVIMLMVVSALASGNAVAAAGAVLFAGSDSLIAWDRFVRPLRWAAVTIMVTYHLGQALLVLSLLD